MLRDSSPFPKSNTENPLGRVAPCAPGSRAFGLRACVCMGGPAGDALSGWRDSERRSLACGRHCRLSAQWGLSVCWSVAVSTQLSCLGDTGRTLPLNRAVPTAAPWAPTPPASGGGSACSGAAGRGSVPGTRSLQPLPPVLPALPLIWSAHCYLQEIFPLKVLISISVPGPEL